MVRYWLTSLAVSLVILAGCSKSNSKEEATRDKASASRPSPRVSEELGDVVGYLHLPVGNSVNELIAAAEVIDPGASATLEAELSRALQTVAGMDLSGADLTAPFALVVVNPKKYSSPVGLLVKAKDVKALKSAAKDSGLEVVTENGLSFVAAPDVVKAARDFAFGQLSAPPEQAIVTIYPQPLIVAYRAEIDMGLAQLERQFAQSGAIAQTGFIIDMYRSFLSSIEGQVDRIELSLGATKDTAELFWTVYPVARSTFADFVAAQTPTSHSLLGKLPAGTDSAFVMSGTLRAGAARDALFAMTDDWMKSIYGEAQAPALRESTLAWMRLLDGEVALVASGPMQGMRMQYLTGITDAKATTKAWRSLWSDFAKMADREGYVEIMGMRQKVTFEQRAFTHAGVEVDRYTSEIDLSSLDTVTRAAMMQFGGGKSDIHAAVVDKYTIMTMTDPEGTTIRKLIDSSKGADPGGPGGAGITAALARSMAHKESALLFMDLTKLSPMAMPPGMPLKVAFGLGAKDGALVFRMAISR